MTKGYTTNEANSNAGTKRKLGEPPPTPESWTQLTKVVVGLGDAQKEFQVHTHILRKNPFFRSCLDADMIEKRENCVRLPEDEPDAFNWIVCWLYHRCLPVDLVADTAGEPPNLTGDNNYSLELSAKHQTTLAAYITARKLMVEDLQNHLLDLFRELFNYIMFAPESLRLVCDSLPLDDGLCVMLKQSLAVHIHRSGGWHEWKKREDEFYTEFAALGADYMELVVEAVLENPELKEPSEIGRQCDLHTHIETLRCGSTAKKARTA